MDHKTNEKLIKSRLFKTRLIGRVVARLPFVRCVILNGSLASGGHQKSSDIDILIIAKNGRIFTARFLVNVLAMALGIKRSSDRNKLHAGKFCFNYFLTESFLKIPTGRGTEMDQYCAQNYSASQYIAGDKKLFDIFMRTNKELFKKYGFKYKKLKILDKKHRLKIKNISLQRILELLFGDRFEGVVKRYQVRRIESDPRTKKYPDLIVFNDQELRFHPPKSKL